MGLALDFSLTEQQKKLAGVVGIALVIVLVVAMYFMFRGPSFDMARLTDLENSGRSASAEDLEKLAPMLNHPDAKVREQVSRYFTGAPTTVISAAVRQGGKNLDPRARRILEARYMDASPVEAVEYAAAELRTADTDRQRDLLALLGQAKTPDAVPYVLAAVESKDETTAADALNNIAMNTHLHTDQAKQSLDRIINDANAPQRARAHALRARNSMSGRPYRPGMNPDGR
jgi:hypothetical protein